VITRRATDDRDTGAGLQGGLPMLDEGAGELVVGEEGPDGESLGSMLSWALGGATLLSLTLIARGFAVVARRIGDRAMETTKGAEE
jgi:hypothetical protein